MRAHGGKSRQTFAGMLWLLCDALNMISHFHLLFLVANQF